MGAHHNVIEINGKKYDAVTGALLDEPKKPKHPPQTTTGTVVDGFVKRPEHSSTPQKADVVRHQPQHHPRHKTQRSQTLVRRAVPKPATQAKTGSAPRGINAHSVVVPHTTLVGQISPERAKRAETTKKSSLIQRFTFGVVKPATSSSEVAHMPVKEQPKSSTHSPHTHHPIEQKTTQQTKAAFDQSVARADSHKAHTLKKPKLHHRVAKRFNVSSRTVGAFAGISAFLLLAGFFTYQNVPNFAVRVASTRAGFGASMPGYSPAGYSFSGPIKYSPGQIVVSFRSNSNDNAFNVTQKSSNWNSDALLNNFIVANNKQYQTYLDKGQTIYIYDGNDAAWVNKGVWYQIDGSAELTSDQLVRIASSM